MALSNGANVNCVGAEDQWSSLMQVCGRDDWEIAEHAVHELIPSGAVLTQSHSSEIFMAIHVG